MRTVGDAPARSSPPARSGGEHEPLDADARAELDALRLRAYGPASDIAGDPAALARLVDLEDRVLPRIGRVEDEPDAAPESTVTVDDPAPSEESPSAPEHRTERGDRRRRRLGPVAAVAVLAIALGSIGAGQAARQAEIDAALRESSAVPATGGIDAAADGDILIRVLIDASTGDYIDLSADTDLPAFPISGDMTWAQPLGEYYGWALWIGAAPSRRGDEHCLLVASEQGTRARCVAREWRADGDLLVSVPYAQIAPEERPEGMTPEQSVGFLWGPGGFVTIMVTPGTGR